MTLELDSILLRQRARGEMKNNGVTGKSKGVNKWLPSKDIGSFNYVITNKSKVQSHIVGVVGGESYSLRPGKSIKFKGSFELRFEESTAKLITRGYLNLKIEDIVEKKKEVNKKEEQIETEKEEPNEEVNNKKQEKIEPPKKGMCECGRKLSPMNKTGVCLYCRQKKTGGK